MSLLHTAPSTAPRPPGAALAAAWALCAAAAQAQTALPADVVAAVRQAFGDGPLRTMSGSADLDGDGRTEWLVHVVGPTTCGTGGCPLMVFAPTAQGWRLVSTIGPSHTPVGLASQSSSGWRDLVVRIAGGGIQRADMQLSFNGKSYPRNPTVQGPGVKPAAHAGEPVIAEQKAFEDATPLPAAPAPTAGTAPSFACAKAGGPVEKAVCGDAQLAALDRALAQAYGKALAPQSSWGDADKAAARRAQRAWVAERNACSSAADARNCIADSYARRLVELKIALGEAGVVPTAVGYRCQGAETLPVFATFYNQTEPRAAVVTVGDRQATAFAVPSGSGARYATRNVALWDHHGEATLDWFGKRYSCKVQ